MKNIFIVADKISADYKTDINICDWDDDVAEVLKQEILAISNKAYFEVRNAVGPVVHSPIEAGKVSEFDIANTQNVSREVDNIASELADIENYLNAFKA